MANLKFDLANLFAQSAANATALQKLAREVISLSSALMLIGVLGSCSTHCGCEEKRAPSTAKWHTIDDLQKTQSPSQTSK